MVDWWKNSPAHRELMLSRSYNYAGVGIAQEGDRVLWTIVFVNQADHTAPVARIDARTDVQPAGRWPPPQTTLHWWGHDRRLATRTSGLNSFSVQHRCRAADGTPSSSARRPARPPGTCRRDAPLPGPGPGQPRQHQPLAGRHAHRGPRLQDPVAGPHRHRSTRAGLPTGPGFRVCIGPSPPAAPDDRPIGSALGGTAHCARDAPASRVAHSLTARPPLP